MTLEELILIFEQLYRINYLRNTSFDLEMISKLPEQLKYMNNLGKEILLSKPGTFSGVAPTWNWKKLYKDQNKVHQVSLDKLEKMIL